MTDQPQHRTLTRSTTDRWIGGVCGGLADYAGWDPTVVRIVALVLLLIGVGTVGVVYVVAWALMPKEVPPVAPPMNPPAPPTTPAP